MIDRVHFYERQYLRAFDLVAEQEYHLEMRRRLNLALHLWGIVDGFDVAKGAVVPGAPEQFIISPGMAIDGFGREIVSPVAYALSDEDLRKNRVQLAGDYWLSVVYRRELTTPPAPGYRLCDLKDQFTRWHESFAFLITDANPTPTPATAPGVADPLPDDPTDHEWPVVLGKVRVVISPSGNLTIDDAWLADRVYVGSRSERLVSPVASLPSGAEARRPIRILADGLAEKNLATGEDFFVDETKVTPPPTAAPFPTATGNLKVGTDLFVRGEIYKYHAANQEWLALKESLAQLMPDIQVPPSPHPMVVITAINSGNATPSTGELAVSLTTRLLAPSKFELVASLAGIKWLSKQNENSWVAATIVNVIGNSTPLQVSLKVLPNPTKTSLATGTQYDFKVQWTVGPTVQPPPTPPLHVVEIHVSCIGIFLP